MEVKGRIVVVTGGGGGIGGALCRRFAAEGAEAVVVADLNPEHAEAVAAEVGGTAVVTDVAVESDVQRLVSRTLDEHGRLDIYCSNAGIAFAGRPRGSRRCLASQLGCPRDGARLRGSRRGARDAGRGEGYILGTVSAAGLLNHVLAAPYAVTKAAALSLFEWLAVAYGDQGIRISALCPQGVRTDMLAMEGERSFLAAGALEPEQVANDVIEAMREERFLILPHPDVTE